MIDSSSNSFYEPMWHSRLMDTIATRIKSLRISKGLSQRKLAENCNVSQPTIANIERGRTEEIKGYVLEALARELSTTSHYILEGAIDQEAHEQSMIAAELKSIFSRMNDADRAQLLRLARCLLSTSEVDASEIHPRPNTPAPTKKRAARHH